MMTFADKVRKVVQAIPRGQTMTYGEVAAYAGSPGAARAVGSIMKQNFDPTIPCHRVVRADGAGKYNRGGMQTKLELLRQEGVKI